MAEYWDEDVSEKDVKHFESGTIPTYDKNYAEKVIAETEQLHGIKLSEKRKEEIRKRYRYIGKE